MRNVGCIRRIISGGNRQPTNGTSDDIRKFKKKLSESQASELRILSEYFQDELAHIVRILPRRITRELISRNIITSGVEHYKAMEKELGASVASEFLVQEIFNMGREAMTGFWEILFALQADYSHPNLLSVLSEIGQKGQTLVALILLDQEGHPLSEELEDCVVLNFILGSCGEMDRLQLENCCIHGEGLARLASSLHNIQEIRLGDNDLTDKDMHILQAVLSHPKCRIQKLSLRNNGLRTSSCTVLACAMMNDTLEELDLSRNNMVGPEFRNLVVALSNPKCRVKNLFLQDVKLTDEYAPLLVSLSNNPNLTNLDLSKNFLTDSSGSHIQELILRSVSLKEIKLDVNELSKMMAEAIKQLENVKPGISINT